jgi:hypothetical protein
MWKKTASFAAEFDTTCLYAGIVCTRTQSNLCGHETAHWNTDYYYNLVPKLLSLPPLASGSFIIALVRCGFLFVNVLKRHAFYVSSHTYGTHKKWYHAPDNSATVRRASVVNAIM